MTNDELQSQVIDFLRFPLAVGVVVIHASADELVMNGVNVLDPESLPVYDNLSYLLARVFAAIAVPLFFFISGFLFFYRIPRFTSRDYKRKLKSRAKSLLAPYVFWNLVIILFYFLVQHFMPELMSGRKKLISDYTLSDWLWAFWDTSMINADAEGRFPFNFPLWFIRDLMVMALLSPVIYFLVRKLRWVIVACLGVLWICKWGLGIPGLSTVALFFFSGGAWFSVHGKNFVMRIKPLLPFSAIAYILLSAVVLYFRNEGWCGYLGRVNILIGIIFVVSLSARFIAAGKWKTSAFLAGSSFFLYAYHGMPTTFVIKFMFKALKPQGEVAVISTYFLTVVIVVAVGLLLYKLIKKYLSALSPLLTGSR